jgi:hypothetical protein
MAIAQLDLSFSMGYGRYSLTTIKDFQQTIQNSFPVPDAEASDQFPPYYFYQLSSKAPISENNMFGVTLSYGSTGGRISYSDYSGSLVAEQLIKYYGFNLSIGPYYKLPNNLDLFIDFKPGLTITNLELTAQQVIQSSRSNDSNQFRSTNFGIQPTFNLSKRFGDFSAFIFAGYQVTISSGKLKLTENKDLHLVDNKSQDVLAVWDGVRLGLGITCYFIKKK